jgi:hypothetical protein
VQLLDGKYQVPILTPNDITVFDSEAAEFAGIEVLIILRMRVATDKIAYIHSLRGIVAECQVDSQVACVLCFNNLKSLHHHFFLKFLPDVCASDALLQDEKLHPLVYDILMILADEYLSRALVFFWQRLCSLLFADVNIG